VKLAVLRYPDRVLMGQVDAEGEAMILGMPLPSAAAPHSYAPREDGEGMLSTGPLCRHCDHPRNHQLHQDVDDEDPDELEPATGPIPVRLYEPVEIYKLVMPIQTQVGAQGFGVVSVPEVLPMSYVTAHFERSQWDGLYALEGEALERIVQDYLALLGKGAPVTIAVGEPAARGRRRIVEG